MEIENEDVYSIKTQEDDTSNDFINEINASKNKMYLDQLASFFKICNIDKNKIQKLLFNATKLKSIKTENNNLIFLSNFIEHIYKIKYDITSNNIEEAINEINSMNIEILKNNEKLLFILQKQILINLIKKNKVNESLNYAKKNIIPLIKGNKKLFQELSDIMFLLSFKNINDCIDKDLLIVDDKKLNDILYKTIYIILVYFIGDKIDVDIL